MEDFICDDPRREKDRLSNMKEEVEECEKQSVKMEREDGVRDAEGMRRDQEKARDEQKVVTNLTCQTQKCEKKSS